MAERADVVISWNMGTVPASMRTSFTRPTRFIDLAIPAGRKYQEQLSGFGWPYPIRTLIRTRLGADFEPLRVCTMGFSESCTGVRILLQSRDAQLLDTAIAIDGVHAQFLAGSPNKERSNIDPALLAAWFAFAKLAATGTDRTGAAPAISGQRHCIITHSAIRPPYVSTTETAASILSRIFGTEWPSPVLPPGLIGVSEDPAYVAPAGQLPGGGAKYPETVYAVSPDKYQAGDGGLLVLGYENLDPTGIGDHKYQAQRVMPRVLQLLLIDRWNREDPTQGVCVSSSATVSASALNCSLTNPTGVTVPPGAYASKDDLSTDWQSYLQAPGGSGGSAKPPPAAPPAPGAGPSSGGVSVLGVALSIAGGAAAGLLGFKAWEAWQNQ